MPAAIAACASGVRKRVALFAEPGGADQQAELPHVRTSRAARGRSRLLLFDVAGRYGEEPGGDCPGVCGRHAFEFMAGAP